MFVDRIGQIVIYIGCSEKSLLKILIKVDSICDKKYIALVYKLLCFFFLFFDSLKPVYSN